MLSTFRFFIIFLFAFSIIVELLFQIIVVFLISLFCRAWREKLEKAEIRKLEETKDLQVFSFSNIFSFNLYIHIFYPI